MGELEGELTLSGFDGRPDLARFNPDDLVIRAQSGEARAFERLMERHESLVLRTALRMLGNREDALDAAQEVFVRLYRFLPKVDPGQPLEPWLYRTTLNACHDLAKKRKRWSITAAAIRPESTTEGTEKRLDAVEQLDVPPPPVKNVEVIVYLVVATKGGEIAPGLEPCGPQLDPVVEQLNAVFGYERFGLVDTLLLRGRDGSGIEASGFLTAFAATNESGQALPSQYQFRVDDLRVQTMPDAVARISLNRLIFSTELSIPSPTGAGPNGQRFTQISRQQMGISADLDVQEGQMAVVGKANVSTQGEVVFVVVSAKVVTE
jgi:RNA polymerase sigma factor (sigma-70 family)